MIVSNRSLFEIIDSQLQIVDELLPDAREIVKSLEQLRYDLALIRRSVERNAEQERGKDAPQTD